MCVTAFWSATKSWKSKQRVAVWKLCFHSLTEWWSSICLNMVSVSLSLHLCASRAAHRISHHLCPSSFSCAASLLSHVTAAPAAWLPHWAQRGETRTNKNTRTHMTCAGKQIRNDADRVRLSIKCWRKRHVTTNIWPIIKRHLQRLSRTLQFH